MPTFQSLPTIVAGDDYLATVTLTKDGASYDTTGHTATVSIIHSEHPETKVMADHAVTEGATNALTLTAAETALLRPPSDHTKSAVHYADFKVVESGGATVHSERFWVPVRRGAT